MRSLQQDNNKIDEYNLVTSALSLFPFLFITFYSVTRVGFDHDFVLYFKITGVSLLLLNIDCLWNERGGVSKSNFYVIAFLVITGLFFFLEITALVGNVIAIFGYAFFVLNVVTNFSLFKDKKKWPLVVITGIALVVLTLYVFSVFYTNFLTPFSCDLISSRGVHIDTLFHASITQMLKTYHIPTTGVDGLNVVKYHFGSHVIAAALSKLLDMNVLLYYQMGFPVIVFPLLFKAFLYFVLDLSALGRGEEKNNFLIFLLLFLAGFIGFLNYDGVNKIALKALIGWQNIYTSESYTLSMLFLFATLSTVIKFKNNFQKEIGLAHFIFVFLFFTLFIVNGFTKISTGFLIFCLTQYFFLRTEAYKKIFWVVVDVVFVAIAWWIYSALNDPHDGEGGWYYFHLINEVNQAPIIWFILLHFFWTIAIVFYYLFYFRIKNARELFHAFRRKRLLLAEVVLVMSIAGLIPGNVMWFYNRNAAYFSEPQNWVALAIIIYLAYYQPIDHESLSTYVKRHVVFVIVVLSIPFYDHVFSDWLDTSIVFSFVPVIVAFALPSIRQIKPVALKYFLLAGVFFPLLTEIKHNIMVLEDRMRHLTNTIRTGLIPNEKTALEYNHHHWPHGAAISEKWQMLNRDSLHLFYRQLFALDKWTAEEKKKAIVFVASRNAYKKIYPCQALPFIMPAITGIVQYRGLEPSDLCDNYSFGLEYFQWYPSSEMAKVDVGSVEEDVGGKGYKNLVVVDVDKKTVVVTSLIKSDKERIEGESCASRVVSSDNAPKHVMLGPLANLPAGNRKFRFYLKTDNIIDNEVIATLDIIVNNSSLIDKDLRGTDFTKKNQYQYFDIEYKNDVKLSDVDFRVYYYGKGNLGVHHVQIESFEKNSYEWNSVDLPSGTGEIIFDNTLNHRVRHANTSMKLGHLVFGPYSTLQPGEYDLAFWLKVKGSKGDNVAYIDVVANNSTQLLSGLEIDISEMNAKDEYVKYNIPFSLCKKGENIEFRMYYKGKGEIWLDKLSLTQKRIFAR